MPSDLDIISSRFSSRDIKSPAPVPKLSYQAPGGSDCFGCLIPPVPPPLDRCMRFMEYLADRGGLSLHRGPNVTSGRMSHLFLVSSMQMTLRKAHSDRNVSLPAMRIEPRTSRTRGLSTNHWAAMLSCVLMRIVALIHPTGIFWWLTKIWKSCLTGGVRWLAWSCLWKLYHGTDPCTVIHTVVYQLWV